MSKVESSAKLYHCVWYSINSFLRARRQKYLVGRKLKKTIGRIDAPVECFCLPSKRTALRMSRVWGRPCAGLLPPRMCAFISFSITVCTHCQVCGQNPAYDFFPSQHQIFYRGRGNGQMWYDPVFKVVTIEGKEVSQPSSDFGCMFPPLSGDGSTAAEYFLCCL